MFCCLCRSIKRYSSWVGLCKTRSDTRLDGIHKNSALYYCKNPALANINLKKYCSINFAFYCRLPGRQPLKTELINLKSKEIDMVAARTKCTRCYFSILNASKNRLSSGIVLIAALPMQMMRVLVDLAENRVTYHERCVERVEEIRSVACNVFAKQWIPKTRY